MKKTMKYFSMAALAFVGAMITSCSNSSDFEETPAQPQPASGDNVVTLTTTVSMAGGETRALTSDGVKTFAEGERMAVVYENTSGSMVRAVSEALTPSDIGVLSKAATFTVTLTNPKADGHLKYIYPAAMSTDGGGINYSALNNQNGTLTNISSYYDLGFYEGTFDGSNLRSVTLNNQLAILALKLKNDAGGSEITSSITGLTLSDGTNTYNVTREAGEGPIYVAIRPTASKTIEVTATDGTKTYAKALSSKTYAASNGYNLTWRMAEVIKGKFSVSSTKQVYFSKGNLRASKNSSWSWSFAPDQIWYVGNASSNDQIIGDGNLSTLSDYLYVDLFGWSTAARHYGISNNTTNSSYSDEFVDWGSADEIKAGIGTGWYTLESSKWRYILKTRTTASGIRYTKASIDGAYGLILLPDDWSTAYYTLNSKYLNDDCAGIGYASCNTITAANWTSKLEAHGAVFLRAAGQREGQTITMNNGRGYYWSCNEVNSESGIRLYFAGNEVSPDAGGGKHFGYSVRLVRDVK